MDSAKICLFALICVGIAVLIKTWRADFLPLVRLCAAILLAGLAVTLSSPTIAYLQKLTGMTGLSSYAALPIKALGILLLTEVTASLCRDAGESGIAAGVEMAGKLEILLLCLPLLDELLTCAQELLSFS